MIIARIKPQLNKITALDLPGLFSAHKTMVLEISSVIRNVAHEPIKSLIRIKIIFKEVGNKTTVTMSFTAFFASNAFVCFSPII